MTPLNEDETISKSFSTQISIQNLILEWFFRKEFISMAWVQRYFEDYKFENLIICFDLPLKRENFERDRNNLLKFLNHNFKFAFYPF